ncbi:hypothetical protein [Rheinheimera sp. A13L]|uniref:hypothetical protein n=1 Tax=Rheinheimera sp. A13L TaxID=506534 RepID=UPI00031F913E|nr:hypothetical protein [Rheinheimera sp. A13L]
MARKTKPNLLLKIADICGSFYQILRFFAKKIWFLNKGSSSGAVRGKHSRACGIFYIKNGT